MKFQKLFSHTWSLLILLVLGAIPLAFNNSGGKTTFNFMVILEQINQFFKGLLNGSAFYYFTVSRELFFFDVASKGFMTSFLFLFVAGIIVLCLGIVFGIWFWKMSEKRLQPITSFVSMIPDFVLVLMLQLLVIFIYQKTGFRIAKVASFQMDDPAILLPLITLIVLPLVYLIGSLNENTYDVLTESYIRTARAKGLNKRQIYLYHVTTNVIPFLKGDLHKIVSIMIGSLFIVEYLFNNKGLTSLLFPMNFKYQYNLVVLSFISFFILYATIYYILRLFIFFLERVLHHEKAL